MKSPISPAEAEAKLQLARSFMKTISEVEHMWMLSIILLAFFPPIPKTWRGTFMRISLVTLIGWVWAVWFRSEIRLGWALITSDFAAYPEHSQYDGVGGNVVTLVFGWVPFLFGSAIAFLLAYGLRGLLNKILLILNPSPSND